MPAVASRDRSRAHAGWFPLAALCLLAAPAAAHAGAIADSIRQVTLGNGLRLVLAPDPAAAAVDVAVWYDVGSRHDRPGKTGLAQLFERLMNAGSARFGPNEHSRLIRAEGGSSGSYSAPDFTCFYQTIPPDALDLAFRLEADRMTGLRLTQEALDRERVRAESDRVRQSSSISRGLERLYSQAYLVHPYRRPLHGEAADRDRITLADALDFYRRRYGPRNAVVTVVGKFDPERALAMARERFGSLRSAGAGEPAKPEPEPPQSGERRISEALPVTVRVLMGAWRVPPRSDPDWAAANLLSIVLARGATSRLSRTLTEDGLCLSVQGGLNTRKDESLLYFVAAVVPEGDSAQVEARLDRVVADLIAEPVSADELERAKRQAETGAWLGLQNSRDRAEALGHAVMMTGDPRDLDRQLARSRAATAADLQRVARRLERRGRNLVWLLPARSPAEGRP